MPDEVPFAQGAPPARESAVTPSAAHHPEAQARAAASSEAAAPAGTSTANRGLPESDRTTHVTEDGAVAWEASADGASFSQWPSAAWCTVWVPFRTV